MKKVMLVVSAIALVACFASCDKKCTCKTYLLGVEKETVETSVKELKVDKCSDATMVTDMPGVGKNGLECK